MCVLIYTVLVPSNGIYTDFSLVNNYTLLDVLVLHVLVQCYYTCNILLLLTKYHD